MNKKTIIIILIAALAIVLAIALTFSNSGSNNQNTENEKGNTVTEQQSEDKKQQSKINIEINGRTISATLEDNSSAKALLEKLENGNISVKMEDYANFEKVGSLGFSLPTNDEQMTTSYGDIILYQGDKLVIYYDSNSWSFTKLGRIDGLSQDELKDLLGPGDLTVTLSK